MANSTYRPEIPALNYTIQEMPCHLDKKLVASETCVCLLKRDLKKLVVELKAACLALGNSPHDCQTDD